MQETLFNYPNLSIRPASVFDLVFDHDPLQTLDQSSAGKWASVAGVRLGGSLLILWIDMIALKYSPLSYRLGRGYILL